MTICIVDTLRLMVGVKEKNGEQMQQSDIIVSVGYRILMPRRCKIFQITTLINEWSKLMIGTSSLNLRMPSSRVLTFYCFVSPTINLKIFDWIADG